MPPKKSIESGFFGSIIPIAYFVGKPSLLNKNNKLIISKYNHHVIYPR